MEAKTISTLDRSWEVAIPSEGTFSSDEVIDAYLKGQQDALENATRLIAKTLDEGVQQCAFISKEIISFLKNRSFSPSTAFLRINSPFSFDALIGVSEADFLSEEMFEVYEFITDLEEENNKEFFHISISVSDLGDDFDEEAIFADRYLLKLKDK